ncbi:MAG: type II secretion system F family protein [Gammaproteobacteria bacterium]|nr:type II secretion system F family protein [Gammaproteobacteria bacterium]
MRRAGVDDELSPQQFLAVTVSAAALAAALLAPLPFEGVAFALWCVALLLPWLWLRDAAKARADEVVRELPVYVDMLTLALEAGGALSVALRVATERSPDSVLRRAFLRVQGDLRAGRTRAEALRALGERLDLPSVRPLVAALVQADASGGSFAAVLRAQADQRLDERFARAEKLAMEAPVKMLLPLVLCIFPCTFVVLAPRARPRDSTSRQVIACSSASRCDDVATHSSDSASRHALRHTRGRHARVHDRRDAGVDSARDGDLRTCAIDGGPPRARIHGQRNRACARCGRCRRSCRRAERDAPASCGRRRLVTLVSDLRCDDRIRRRRGARSSLRMADPGLSGCGRANVAGGLVRCARN